MSNFQQAIQWLKEGKKVRRPSWEDDSYWKLGSAGIILWADETPAKIHLNQINANDWGIYEEEKPLQKFPDVFIERAALCTIEGIRALCGTDEEVCNR